MLFCKSCTTLFINFIGGKIMSEVAALNQVADNGGTSTHNQPQRYFGIYRAICVDNKDQKKSGRIKVNIPALNYTQIKDTDGVWAFPCTPFAAPNLEKKNKVSDFGALYIPPVDSYVYVFFEDGDASKARYFGGVVLEGAIPTEQQSGEQYWNKHTVIKTPEKRMIFVSDDSSSDASIIIRGKDRNAK